MMAWTSPALTVRLMPRRMSLSATLAWRLWIVSMLFSRPSIIITLQNDKGKVILQLARFHQARRLRQIVHECLSAQCLPRFLDFFLARILPNAVRHGEHHPRRFQVGGKGDERRVT